MIKLTGYERLLKSKELKKEQQRKRAKKFYELNKAKKNAEDGVGVGDGENVQLFPNRQAKKRTLDKIKEILPRTPEKKLLS